MIKKYFLLFFLFLIASCKNREVVSNPVVKIVAPSHEPKSIAIDSAQVIALENDLLLAFYKMHHFHTYWNDLDTRETILQSLSNAEEEGLNPKDYNIAKLKKYKDRESLSEKELVEYDLLLTTSLQKYLSDLANGKLNPRMLYDDWDLKPNQFDINERLKNASVADSVRAIVESAKPNHLIYKRLKEALFEIDKFPGDTLKKIEIGKKLVLNDSSELLIGIKKRLIYWRDLKPTDSLTPIFDETLLKAVKKFQSRHGLGADGVIGTGTLAAMNMSKNSRKQQIIANLERWRWCPRNMQEHYIIINIPEYKLHTVRQNDTTRIHNIIVGTSKRKTPILSSKLSYAVFNPTWTVPPTILKEDVIPATIKDIGYLAKKNITIYDKNGKEVSITNWDSEKALNYRYVQSPGNYNSLGMVKIIFPNHFSVYLHDTNHKEYFVKDNRSLSSGCVRVQNPLELTAYLLNDNEKWSLEKITETLQHEKTKNAAFKSDIYIHQLYWTAWSENRILQFRPDIYNLDLDLYIQLRK